MSRWRALLSEDTPPDVLLSLDMPALAARMAARLYAVAMDEARTVYRMDDRKARASRLSELAHSDRETDRIAADIVRQWDEPR